MGEQMCGEVPTSHFVESGTQKGKLVVNVASLNLQRAVLFRGFSTKLLR